MKTSLSKKLLASMKIAFGALLINKLRSALTMLGIIIGVAAVIAMVAVGAGAQVRIQQQIASIGSNIIIVLSGSITSSGVRVGTGNAQTLTEDDAKALTVVNGADGTWSLRDVGMEKSKGTSTFDATKKPKTIDFTPTIGEDKGKKYLGIYELGEKTRKLCFAPVGKDRPTKFSSTPGSHHILVIFERKKSK